MLEAVWLQGSPSSWPSGSVDEGGLQELLQRMAEHHGLVVTIVDATRLTVELDIEVKGRSAHLAVEVALEAAPSNDEWVAATQATAPTCGCGCGEAITVRVPHRSKGLPRYLKGHGPTPLAAHIEATNEAGWLTLGQAAAGAGVSEKVMRRRVDRGEVLGEWRRWGRKRVRVVRS